MANNRPDLSSERASHRHDSNHQTVTNIWSREPEGARNQDTLTVSRNFDFSHMWQYCWGRWEKKQN
jgi:hypothetical protein